MVNELIAWPYTHGTFPGRPEQMIDNYNPGTWDQVIDADTAA